MNRANIKDHMAPTNLSGADIQPMDQAAMAIKFRRQNERHQERKAALYGNASAGPLAMSPYDGSNWRRDYEICESNEKRGHRGGMTMRPTDAISNRPRRTMTDGEL